MPPDRRTHPTPREQEVAKRHSLPSILATCGGHCECATCHVHLAEDAPQPEMRDEEDEQLEFAIGADDDSRCVRSARSLARPRSLGPRSLVEWAWPRAWQARVPSSLD